MEIIFILTKIHPETEESLDIDGEQALSANLRVITC